jgi:hypothetical protein
MRLRLLPDLARAAALRKTNNKLYRHLMLYEQLFAMLSDRSEYEPIRN